MVKILKIKKGKNLIKTKLKSVPLEGGVDSYSYTFINNHQKNPIMDKSVRKPFIINGKKSSSRIVKVTRTWELS